MIQDPLLFPPLPADWPYEPRPHLPSLGCRESMTLPGLGGGWRVCTPGGDAPTGEAEPLDGAFGRGGVLRSGHVVLRPYRRGGWLRHLNERTYRSSMRFAAEHAVHRALWESGFPTVRPLGYAWRPCGWGVEGILLTEFVEGEPWPRRWDLGVARLPELRKAVAALCAWGLWAPDLNATNVLLPEAGGILLLDWDRAHFESEKNLEARYAERLNRSLRKLGTAANFELRPAG